MGTDGITSRKQKSFYYNSMPICSQSKYRHSRYFLKTQMQAWRNGSLGNKWLLCKHEKLGSNPQYSYKKPALGLPRQVDPESLLAQSNRTSDLQVQWDTILNTQDEVWQKITDVLASTWAHVGICTHTLCIHTTHTYTDTHTHALTHTYTQYASQI